MDRRPRRGGDVEESQPGPSFVVEDRNFPEIKAEQRGERLSLLTLKCRGSLGKWHWKLERAPLAPCARSVHSPSSCLESGSSWRETAGPARGSASGTARLSGSAAAAATPHTSPLESAPLPTASNHYPAWSALNMQRRVTSCGSGSIRREQSSIYINVAWVGREGLKGWRRERWAGVYTTLVSAALVGKLVSCSSLCPPSLLLSKEC